MRVLCATCSGLTLMTVAAGVYPPAVQDTPLGRIFQRPSITTMA